MSLGLQVLAIAAQEAAPAGAEQVVPPVLQQVWRDSTWVPQIDSNSHQLPSLPAAT
jgi:hypothetical protein